MFIYKKDFYHLLTSKISEFLPYMMLITFILKHDVRICVVISLVVCKRDVRYPPQNYNLTPKIAHITSNIRTSPLNFFMLFGSVKLNTTGSGWYITNASTPLLDKSSNDLTLSMLKPRSASNLMLRRERIPGLSTSGRGCSNKCRTLLGNLGDGHSISVGLITLHTLIK